jgi:hypothetical protein
MDHDRWTLTAVFDSIAETQAAGVYEGGLGEAAGFYRWLRQYWDNGVPEDMDEIITFEGETVMATSYSVNPFTEPLKWLLNYTVPKSVTLARNTERGS